MGGSNRAVSDNLQIMCFSLQSRRRYTDLKEITSDRLIEHACRFFCRVPAMERRIDADNPDLEAVRRDNDDFLASEADRLRCRIFGEES